MDNLYLFMNHIKNYPFNINLPCQITEIKMKLNNTHIIITNNDIVSDLPIFIEYKENILYIWNTISDPVKINESYQDDISYINYDGNIIKTWAIYHFTYWLIPKITQKVNVLVEGENNNVELICNL